jgi:hypothetical protein
VTTFSHLEFFQRVRNLNLHWAFGVEACWQSEIPDEYMYSRIRLIPS